MTPNHIRMYAEAKKEIQDPWKPEVGHKTDRGIITALGVEAIHTDNYTVHLKKELTFLPDIEWQAARWHEAKPSFTGWGFVERLYIWHRGLSPVHLPDWPEHIIVLAFYMSEIHGKRWSGKEGWVDG